MRSAASSSSRLFLRPDGAGIADRPRGSRKLRQSIAFIKTRSCQLTKDAQGHYYVSGVMSDDKVDRDGDAMSTALLHAWAAQINKETLNMYVDHSHNIDDIVGVWNKASVVNGQLKVEGRLEDPDKSPKAARIVSKLETGAKVGISIGGDLSNSTKEFDTHSGGSIRRITEANLYEASLVGIPSNPNSFVEGYTFKSWEPLFEKGGAIPEPWASQMVQEQAQANQLQELEQHANTQAHLHDLNQMHDASVCTRCRDNGHPAWTGTNHKFDQTENFVSGNWPNTIAFDLNGTLDLRGTGDGIPLSVLQSLVQSGKNVVVFTSSVDSSEKVFMRAVLTQAGIPFTDDETILQNCDMFVGDKASDMKRAGQYGVKFVQASDFNLGMMQYGKPADAPKVQGGNDTDNFENKSYNQSQDPAYSGAFVSGQATDGKYETFSEMTEPTRFEYPSVQQAKPSERFLTDDTPDKDKLLQLRTPMQPDAKIPAEPGKSGSSEVFRTDLGQKIDIGKSSVEDDQYLHELYETHDPAKCGYGHVAKARGHWIKVAKLVVYVKSGAVSMRPDGAQGYREEVTSDELKLTADEFLTSRKEDDEPTAQSEYEGQTAAGNPAAKTETVVGRNRVVLDDPTKADTKVEEQYSGIGSELFEEDGFRQPKLKITKR